MSKKKRRGDDAGIDMQVSKEQFGMADEGEQSSLSGTFKRADDSVLKKRVIRKAKRRLGPSSAASANPFASVNLLNPNPSSKPNPNQGDSNTGATAVDAPAFGTKPTSSTGLFGSLGAKAPAGSSTGSGLFGSIGSAGSGVGVKEKSKQEPFKNPFAAASSSSGAGLGVSSGSIFSSKPVESMASKSMFGGLGSSSSSAPAFTSSNGGLQESGGTGDHGEEYLYDVAALNKAFRAWIQKQDVDKSWADGVTDYIAFADKLRAEKDAKQNGKSSAASASTSTGKEPVKSTGFTSGLFANGSMFSGSAGAMGTDGNAAKPTEEQPAEEQEEAIKVEAKLADDEELLHEVRSKVLWFRKKPGDAADSGSWGAKGTGQLQLLKQKTGSLRWLLMRTETTGRVTFNAPLFKGMKVDVDEKGKAVTFVGVSYQESKTGALEKENDGNPSLFRLKVKQVTDAHALAKAIRDAAPQ